MFGTWRIAAWLITGPLAFFLGGLVEAAAYWRGRAREALRLSRGRGRRPAGS